MAIMADNPLSVPAGDGPPKRNGWWKCAIDMLLGNRVIFQNRTGRTPSLDNIPDNHKQRGLLRSDANQALDISRTRNRAQDAGGRASVTSQSVAAQSGAQQPRWGGPGGKKMYAFMPMMTEERANPYRTPRELAAYEVTQSHLQQPFRPIDLFREMWGDNHAEPAFWSGYASMSTILEARANAFRVPRESHIKYYAEYNANTGRKVSKHAHTGNMSGRPRNINKEEELDLDERNSVGPPSSQEKDGFEKKPTRDFNGHDKIHHSRSRQERAHTPGICRAASAINAFSPYVPEERLFGHSPPLNPFGGGGNENFLKEDRAQRRATQPGGQASSRIRNYRGVSFNSSNFGRVSNDFLDEFGNPPRLPESEQETNSGAVPNDFLDEFERPPHLPGDTQQSVQQQQRREKLTIIGELTQHIPIGNELSKQQSSRKQRRREEETVIDNIIQEIPLANQLAKEKREEDQHHAEQHHSLLRSASEGSVVALGRANPGGEMIVATTIDADGGKHRHSISGELLRTTSKPAHGKQNITTDTWVSELPLHGLHRPTFTPASHTTEHQRSRSKDASFGRIVSNDFQGVVPSIPRRSSSHGQASGLLASDSLNFGQRVARSPFIQEDYSQAVFSDDENAAEAPSISKSRSSAAHGSVQTQSWSFQFSSDRNMGVDRQTSGRYDDGAVTSQRLALSPYEYQFDPSAIASLSPQGTGKKYLRSKRSGNRLHSIEDLGTRSPQSPTLARQARQVSGQNALVIGRPYQQMLQRAVEPRRSSGTPPNTKSMKDAVNAYDPPGTPSKPFLGGIQAGALTHGEGLSQSKRQRDSEKFTESPLPFDPHDDQSIENFIIESITPDARRTKLMHQPIHILRSVRSTMSEEDALNFLVEDLFPPGKDTLRFENVEVSSSNNANYRPRRKSLLSMEVVPDDETLQPSADGSMEDAEERAPQLSRAHSITTSMGDQTIRPVDTFVSSGRPSENAPTTVSEISGDTIDNDEIRRTPLAKNRLGTPLNRPLFPDEIKGKDSIEVTQMLNEVYKRRSEPFVPKTKPVVVKMTRTSLPSRVASGMLCAISTSARSEVEDDLPDFAPRPVVKQENADEETPQQLGKRKSAKIRMMRLCFSFDGASDDRPEHEPKSEGSKRIPRTHDFSGSGLLDERLEWPIGDVDKTSGSNVSKFAGDVSRPPSSAVTQASEPRKLMKQEIDGNLAQAIKTVSEELAATDTRTAEVSMKGTGASSSPFSQKLELDSSTSEQSPRRPSSPDKKRCEELLNQYDAKLNPDSQLPHQSSETPRLSHMKSLRKLFNVKDKKEFPPLLFVRKKTWPPNPTVEDAEEPRQDIFPEEPLLSKHVMIDVAQPDPPLQTDEESIVPKEVCKVSSATEYTGASLCTDEKSAIPKEERSVFFAIPHDHANHQLTKVATDEKPTAAKVFRKVSFSTEHTGPSPCTGEKPIIQKPIRKISSAIEYGLVNNQMPGVARSENGTESITEWSLVSFIDPTHREVEESVRVGQEVPLNIVPELYRKTDVATHGPGYMETRKDRTTGKGDFEGYMAVLPSYLQNPDFPLVSMSPENGKEEKIVPLASQGGAVRCVPDLLTHVGGTFRHLFDGEPSMTTDPANVTLPGSPDGGSFNWDDEEADGFNELEGFSFNWENEEVVCFDAFEEGCVKLFEEELSGTTDPASVPLPGPPDASSFTRDDEEVDRSDNLEGLELFNVHPDPEPKMGMKLKRHFSSSWRPFPHKIVEPNIVSIPTRIRFRIYQMLLPFSHQHPILLSPVATTLKFWPERSFRSPSDIFDKIGAMTSVSRQFHDEIMAFYLSQLRFHVTLNCRVAESLAPKMWQWLPLFASQMQYLTVEMDFTKGSGNYKDGCALRLDGVAELEKLLGKVIVPLSKRDKPMRGLTIMARRYQGNRPSGQLVPYKTTTSPYQGNEIIRGQGLGKVEQPEDENWSMIDGLAALPGFGDIDDELFYSIPHQKPKRETKWKTWFNLKSKPTKAKKQAKPRDKMGKSATAQRLAQNRRPSGFKVTALRLLTGKSPMPDLNEALFAKNKPECPPMSPQPPPEPPRQKWYDHFSPSSSRGSLRFSEWGTPPRTSQTPQMSSPAQTPSADQRVFVPTSEAFKDPLPLFDGRRGSAMMGNWSTEVETALGASVAAIEAREKALEAHTEYGYNEEQDKRQRRITRIKKMSYNRDMGRRVKREPRRWFMSKKAARRKRVAMRQTKRPLLRRSSRHGRHRKALRRRHEKIDMARKDKSLRRRTMPKYKYRVFQAMEQLHRGSIPNKVTVFKKTGFFRTRKGKKHVAFLKRRPQTPRAGMLMSSQYLPHDPVDNTLETLVACFGPPNGPGFLFLRLAGFTRGRSEEICMQLVCKAMPIQPKGGGRKLWPKEAVGTFGKRRAGARFARFEVFEEANSIPERRGRIIKVEDKEDEKQQSNDGNKELADAEQQCDGRRKDIARNKPQQDDEKELAEVLGPIVDAQAKSAEGFNAQRATMKKKVEVEHKHARQEFEFKMVHGKRKRKLKAAKAKEAADLRKDTTHVSSFFKKHFKKSGVLSRVGGRRKWRALGMKDDDYDDYRVFR